MIKSKANTSFITQPNYQIICYFKIDLFNEIKKNIYYKYQYV